jgi:cobalt-zinc-cadmium efflux system outer membrane protein
MHFSRFLVICLTSVFGFVGEGQLTLEKAIALTMESNPKLKALYYEASARKSEITQAGRLPNPEVELELSEFAGSGKMKELDSAESTLTFNQKFLLGKKRQKEKRTASLKSAIAQKHMESERQSLVANVTKAFNKVLIAQERVSLQRQVADLSQKTYQTVSARVRAGKVSPLEEVKTKVALSLAHVSLEQAIRELAAARHHLCSFWGGEFPDFAAVEGDLDIHSALPSLNALLKASGKHPDIARTEVIVEFEKAIFDDEMAQRIPDISIKAGLQRFHENQDNAFIIGFSLPLKLFDRNKGNIQAAGHRVNKADQNSLATRVQHASQIHQTYQLITAIHLSASALKLEIIPSAKLAFEASSKGYQEGKFGLLDVLDAQRTLFEIRAEYLDVLLAYHNSLVDLERLSGIKN